MCAVNRRLKNLNLKVIYVLPLLHAAKRNRMSTDSTSTQGIKSYRVYRLKQHHARDCLLQQISIYTMQCSSGAPLKVLRRWKNILLMEKVFYHLISQKKYSFVSVSL